MRGYGPRTRTQADKKQEAILFIFQAAEKMVLDMTPERLCELKGVSNRNDCREVEAKLVARQGALRRQVSAA